MPDHPTLAAELGHAVARGRTSLTMADVVVLANCVDMEKAKEQAAAVRRSLAAWQHIRDAIRLRIRDTTTANARARLPWNVLMAQAHEINQSGSLDEEEVTAIVEAAVYDTLPNRRRRRGT